MVDTTSTKGSFEADSDLSESGAPSTTTEVTPAMVEAGAHAYAMSDRRFEGIEDILPRIFRAMWEARG
jgi:hypothetical protein